MSRQGRRQGNQNNNTSSKTRGKRKIVVNKNKMISSIVIVVALIVFIYCAYQLIFWFINNKHSKDIEEDLLKEVEIIDTQGDVTEKINEPKEDTLNKDYVNDYLYYMSFPFMSVEFSSLKEKNQDTVAWLKVPGTSVNYPVVQTTDNSYYLTHAFDKSKNTAGWIFADYRCNLEDFGRNTIIYGHNRRNNTMFGSLLGTTNTSWCSNRDNTVIYLSTPKYNTMWQVFSVYTIDKSAEYLTTYFDTDEIYESFLNNMKSRSIYNFNSEVDSKDRILTLSTCAKDDNYRVVIQAKLIKREIRN